MLLSIYVFISYTCYQKNLYDNLQINFLKAISFIDMSLL